MACFEVFGLVSPSVTLGKPGCKIVVEENTLTCTWERAGETSVSFKKLFSLGIQNEDAFKFAVEKLIHECLLGFNVSLALLSSTKFSLYPLLFGPTGLTFPFPNKNDSLIARSVGFLFREIGNLNHGVSAKNVRAKTQLPRATITSVSEHNTKVCVKCYEVHENHLVDLLENSMEALETYRRETPAAMNPSDPEQSLTSSLEVGDAITCLKVIQAALNGRRADELQNSEVTLVIELVLFHASPHATNAYQSCFRITLLPSLEVIPLEATGISSSTTAVNNKGLKCLSQVLCCWPSNPSKSMTLYRESYLTASLKDTFGGNGFTSFIIGLEANDMEIMTRVKFFLKLLSKIRNVPIVNTKNAILLIERYDRTLRDLMEMNKQLREGTPQVLHAGSEEIARLQKDLRQLNEEKVSLVGENAALKEELLAMRMKFTQQVESKTLLSSRMVDSEQEKLKMSHTTVELQLENNRLKQDTERLLYELKSKNSVLQSQIESLERHLAIEKRKSLELHEEVQYLEKEHKDLTNEYVNIKHNHSMLTNEYDRQVKQRDSLAKELEDLMSSKEELLMGRDYQEMSALQRFRDNLKKIAKKADKDASQAQASGSASQRSWTAAELKKQLLRNHQDRTEKLENLRLMHDKELKDFEKKMDEVTEKLTSSEALSHRYKLKIAEQNGVCIVLGDKVSYLETVCKAQSDKINHISHAYTQRLQEYICNLKEYVTLQDNQARHKESTAALLDQMLDDFKTCYQSRMEELTSRHERLLSHAQEIYKSKEAILAAYKMALWKLDAKESQDFDINNLDVPLPTDSEIEMQHAKERNDLQSQLILAEEKLSEFQVDHLKKQIAVKDERISDLVKGSGNNAVVNHSENSVSMHMMQRELREFTLNTQLSLEKERADLLTRCQLSEQQLLECQAFIDTYIKRYQQEIVYLRRLVQGNSYVDHALIAQPLNTEQRAILPPLDRTKDRQYHQ